jgi:biopolymer transport protein ExbB/TolQ
MTHLAQDLDHAPLGASAAGAASPFAMMTPPRRYTVRMVVFLAVVAVVAAVLHEHAAHFFLRNPPLNTLILSVLAIGIGLSFRTVSSLAPEVAWIERCRRADGRPLADRADGRPLARSAAPPVLGPLAILLAETGGRPRLTASALRSALDSVDNRLDARRDTSRYLIALLIFLGLLGTFWGLLLTATSVGETIRGLNVEGSDPAQMFATLRAGLEAPLAGMGTAFSTSLFGLASSLVLGFLDLQASQAQNRFANELESWLSDPTSLAGGAPREHAGAPLPSYVTALLQQTAEGLERLERRMVRTADDDERLHETLRGLGERVAALTDALQARREPAASTIGTDHDIHAALKQIGSALEGQAGALDQAMRAHVKSLELGVARLVDDAGRGRERAVDEIRNEIRLLARTISALADRER